MNKPAQNLKHARLAAAHWAADEEIRHRVPALKAIAQHGPQRQRRRRAGRHVQGQVDEVGNALTDSFEEVRRVRCRRSVQPISPCRLRPASRRGHGRFAWNRMNPEFHAVGQVDGADEFSALSPLVRPAHIQHPPRYRLAPKVNPHGHSQAGNFPRNEHLRAHDVRHIEFHGTGSRGRVRCAGAVVSAMRSSSLSMVLPSACGNFSVTALMNCRRRCALVGSMRSV